MGNLFFTSDLHFGHDREFMFKPRGFSSIQEHDEEIIKRWNEVVSNEDTVYILGDLMLGDVCSGMEKLKRLNGIFYVIAGNHDTPNRLGEYLGCDKVCNVMYANRIKLNGYTFFLCHFPTLTANLEKESLKQCTINLYGHTHQKTNFYDDIPFMYHVGMDSHDCRPVAIEQIIEDCKVKVQECKNFL